LNQGRCGLYTAVWAAVLGWSRGLQNGFMAAVMFCRYRMASRVALMLHVRHRPGYAESANPRNNQRTALRTRNLPEIAYNRGIFQDVQLPSVKAQQLRELKSRLGQVKCVLPYIT
jgi:hypothetical protein